MYAHSDSSYSQSYTKWNKRTKYFYKMMDEETVYA